VPDARPIAPGLFVVDADGPRLLAARCRSCGKPHFPAADTCPYCGAADCVEMRAGPEGRLHLYTAVTSRPPGYRGELPYGLGVVEVDAGLLVIARLTESRLDRLAPGRRMRLVVEPLFTDEEGRPVLTPAFCPEDA
jgi:uncharacterized OB-fold protein